MRRALSVVGLVVAAAGFAAFAGLGGGVWYARAEADRVVAAADARAGAAADFAARVIELIRAAVVDARADLAEARAAPPDRASPVARMAARQLHVDLNRARDAVATASDAVVVADAVLDALAAAGDKKERLGVRGEDVGQVRAGLDDAARNLRQAQAVVGGATPDQLSAVEAALDRARAVADDLDRRLADVRGRVEVVRDRAGVWSLRAAAGVTLLSAVGALGQVFLARASWRGLRAG